MRLKVKVRLTTIAALLKKLKRSYRPGALTGVRRVVVCAGLLMLPALFENTAACGQRLNELEGQSDLFLKGKVISSTEITNAGFPSWGQPHATRLEIISEIKARRTGDTIEFLHLTQGPGGWSGGTPPPDCILEPGECYLIFAVSVDKADWLYEPATNYFGKRDVYRQLMRGVAPLHTRDDRRFPDTSATRAYWRELNLLLNDTISTNQLYAIDQLDSMSLAGRRDDQWRRTADFKRSEVLKALLPLVTNTNERVASWAIRSFRVETNAAASLAPFAEKLITVANGGRSSRLRLDAIAALSETRFVSISNSLASLLQDPDPNVRVAAVNLLSGFPGAFSEQALRKGADDASPEVRAAVADVIGTMRSQSLLTVLTRLFADPAGRPKPVAPLTLEQLESGRHIAGTDGGVTIVDDPGFPAANVGDVHTSAGYALLKFERHQVRDILKANLGDTGFRLQFLLKLAEDDPKPWMNDLLEIMEARRARNLKKAETDAISLEVYMALSGSYYHCWNLIYDYLKNLPPNEFADGRMDQHFKVLEQAGVTGSREPVMVYELYKMKGLQQRAARFRNQNGNYRGYSLAEFFDRIDANYPGSVPK
jgi:hypothetical protein